MDRVGNLRKEDPAPWLEKVHGILVPAVSASAVRKARSTRRALPASERCPISASASACRWRSWKRPATSRGRKGLLHRIRPDGRNRGRLMTEWVKGNALEKARGFRRSRRHDAPWRLQGGAQEGYEDRRNLRLPTSPNAPPPLRGERGLQGALEGCGLVFLRLVPGRLCRKRSNTRHPWFIGVQLPPELKRPSARPASALCRASWKRRWSRAGWCEAGAFRAAPDDR